MSTSAADAFENRRAHRMARSILADIQAMTRGVGSDGARWAEVRARRPEAARAVDRVAALLVELVRRVAWRVELVESFGTRELAYVGDLVDAIDDVAQGAGVVLNVERWAHNATEEA